MNFNRRVSVENEPFQSVKIGSIHLRGMALLWAETFTLFFGMLVSFCLIGR